MIVAENEFKFSIVFLRKYGMNSIFYKGLLVVAHHEYADER